MFQNKFRYRRDKWPSDSSETHNKNVKFCTIRLHNVSIITDKLLTKPMKIKETVTVIYV